MSLVTMLEEALEAARNATPEELEEAAVEQYEASIVYSLYEHLTAIAPTLPPSVRWRFALDCDRWALAEEIAESSKPGDTNHDTCRRWAEGLAKNSHDWKARLKTKWVGKGDDAKEVPTEDPINAYLILTFDEEVRGTIRWNDYSKRIEITGGALANRDDMDTTVSATQNWIANEHGPTISRDAIGHMLTLVAREHSYNPLHAYLFGLTWDRGSRIDTFFPRYFNAADTPHSRRISRRFLIGAVARAFPSETWCTAEGRKEGVKFDNVLILEGAQGVKKSAAWGALAGRFYCASAVTIADRDSKMLLASNWFVDSPELASFKRAETNAVKAIVSTQTDVYRAPYARGHDHAPRRCVLVGSTNEERYFDDDTGNRRYWPVKCGRIDLAALMRDRDQILAEAVAIFLGEMDCAACHSSTDTVPGQRPRCKDHRWWLDDAEETEAAAEAEEREADQPWESWKERIEDWWARQKRESRPERISAGEVARLVGELSVDRVTKSVLTTIGIAMRRAGFVRLTSSRRYTPSSELRAVKHRPTRPLFGDSPTCDCTDCKPAALSVVR